MTYRLKLKPMKNKTCILNRILPFALKIYSSILTLVLDGVQRFLRFGYFF